jgi:hypothetical protein
MFLTSPRFLLPDLFLFLDENDLFFFVLVVLVVLPDPCL